MNNVIEKKNYSTPLDFQKEYELARDSLLNKYREETKSCDGLINSIALVNNTLHDDYPENNIDNKDDHDSNYIELIQPGKAVELVNFINSLGIQKFSDQFGEYYIAPNGDGSHIIKLESREFNNWLLWELQENHRKFPNKETVESVKNILSSQIFNNKQIISLSIRAASDGSGKFFYSLGGGQIVQIDKDGWEILKNPPILFKKFNHQKNQPTPLLGGDLYDFLSLINMAEKDDEILLIIYLVSCFLAGFPHPVLVVSGTHGSAKSTLFRLLKSLIDPSALEIMTPVKNGTDFVQAVSHHWACFFDNLSGLKHGLSDDICRACTGGGFSKRALYTNDDDFIYNIQSIIGINGINNVVVNSDLLDRSLLIELARIPEEKRMTDFQIKEKFNNLKPKLLGACFDIASKAVAIEPSLDMKKLYRMADFTRWGCAIAEAMGVGAEKFIEVYEKNIARQNSEAIEASQIGLVLIKLIERELTGILEAEPSYILQQINQLADSINPDYRRNDYWPKEERWLSKRLKEISPSLETMGIKIEFGRGTNRYIRITDSREKDSNIFSE